MTCVEAEKMVVPYMKDELSPTELEDFLDHIHTCENCREELEIHYMVDVGLKKLDEADGTYDIVGDLKRRSQNPTVRCAIFPCFRSQPMQSQR